MYFRIPALALLASLSVAPLAVASIQMKFDQVGPTGGLTASLVYNNESVTARVGQMWFHAKNQSGTPDIDLLDGPDGNSTADNLISFCIELGQYVSGSWKTYNKTPVSAAPDPYVSGSLGGYHIGSHRANALDLLADNYWSNATSNSVVDAVAFQLSVWEIVHEDLSGSTNNPPLAGSLSVSDVQSTFFVSGYSSGTPLGDAVDTANKWLSEIASFYDSDASTVSSLYRNDNLSLIALTNGGWQDQIVQYNLPEPVSAVVWGGLMAFCVCRRQR